MENTEDRKNGILIKLDRINKLGKILGRKDESLKEIDQLCDEFIAIMKKELEKYG